MFGRAIRTFSTSIDYVGGITPFILPRIQSSVFALFNLLLLVRNGSSNLEWYVKYVMDVCF